MITEWKGDIMEVWCTCSKIREKREVRYAICRSRSAQEVLAYSGNR